MERRRTCAKGLLHGMRRVAHEGWLKRRAGQNRAHVLQEAQGEGGPTTVSTPPVPFLTNVLPGTVHASTKTPGLLRRLSLLVTPRRRHVQQSQSLDQGAAATRSEGWIMQVGDWPIALSACQY